MHEEKTRDPVFPPDLVAVPTTLLTNPTAKCFLDAVLEHLTESQNAHRDSRALLWLHFSVKEGES